MTDSNLAVASANLLSVRVRVLLGVMLAVAALAAGGSAGAAGAQASSSASAFGVRVVVPGRHAVTAGAISSPPQTASSLVGWSYGNGAVSVGEIGAGTEATSSGGAGSGRAVASVSSVSLFGGEVTVSSVGLTAVAHATADRAGGSLSGSSLGSLVVLGQPVTAAPNARVELGDWGYAVRLEQAVVRQNSRAKRGQRDFVTGLHVHLTADHGGLPAGTTILVGYAEVAAQAAAAAPPPVKPKKPKGQRLSAKAAPPEPRADGIPVRQPPQVTPKLTAGGYVFPVYGPSSFTDTFGAARSDVSGGWHHGDDIFAPLGAPILAVASGTVFSVGWNRVGGNRLWLRDGQGNLFYYAHLSAFTPLAINGNRVNAGDVLGFVGNTGDAQGTPTHLHFEVHPVGLIGLGYDGAVNPTTYLLAWKHLQDVSFAGGDAWAPLHSIGDAPKPGAILLTVSDISSADGLVPGSLERAIRPLIFRPSKLP
jgi:murein DD-endopeptidase MepM/ murein hydrolase activator NlpD